MKKNHVWQLMVASLAIIALLAVVSVNVFAGSATPNASVTVDKTSAKVGDNIVLTLSNKAMTISSFGAGIEFDTTALELVTLTGNPDVSDDSYQWFGIVKAAGPAMTKYVEATMQTIAGANKDGTLGMAVAGSGDVAYAASTIYTATFKVLKAGTITILPFEDSAGADGFKSEQNPGVLKAITITATSASTTTKAPTTTTKAPTTTTKAAPATTTKAPATTTKASAVTTEAPVVTTEAPVVTTEAPVATTAASSEPTEAPTEPTETTTAGDVKTGDNLTVLWIALAVAAVAVVVLAVVSSKKKAR